MMTHETPDERHDFFGWSIERFGARHFADLGATDFMPIGRHEIAPEEFQKAKRREIGVGYFSDRYGVTSHPIARTLDRPDLELKVVILGTGAFLIVVAALFVTGWLGVV